MWRNILSNYLWTALPPCSGSTFRGFQCTATAPCLHTHNSIHSFPIASAVPLNPFPFLLGTHTHSSCILASSSTRVAISYDMWWPSVSRSHRCVQPSWSIVGNNVSVNMLFLFERHILIQNLYANKIRLHRNHSTIPFSSLYTVCELIIQRAYTCVYLWIQILPRKKGRSHIFSGYYDNVFQWFHSF
jgi:hypothetical protein